MYGWELKRFYFIATICNPREKTILFSGVSEKDDTTNHEWFIADLSSLWNKVSATTSAAPAQVPVPNPAPDVSAPKLGPFQKDFMAGMAHLEERLPARAEVPTVKSEASLYLDLPSVAMDEDMLEWWALNEMKFPVLSVMARQFLGFLAICYGRTSLA